ncbi:SMP-30/gluconolactonase/LRE family protein [Salisediminibacterium halotolerans]|uniref:SMP-30/Gluconolaconase/LRE-like region-containing protein n=1 Tax=Salisediminibacterium halotolerans TaxID=517425 RepID=A0A1H9T262_9BACI|nr:SMP-30/gluconolactonase/LRE family protein [Salisediminibacterium haloalkalitolerans]SER91167.1 SMP-30/Gluconolaconase/LRE-like region-containing protein [Salisediminibacterium haloalkalitolerans]
MLQPELVLDAKATLGEGPCWLPRVNKLLWVDIDGETVNLFDRATGKNEPHPIGQRVGAAVLFMAN